MTIKDNRDNSQQGVQEKKNKRNNQNKENTTIAQLTTHVQNNMHIAQWLLPQYTLALEDFCIE